MTFSGHKGRPQKSLFGHFRATFEFFGVSGVLRGQDFLNFRSRKRKWKRQDSQGQFRFVFTCLATVYPRNSHCSSYGQQGIELVSPASADEVSTTEPAAADDEPQQASANEADAQSWRWGVFGRVAPNSLSPETWVQTLAVSDFRSLVAQRSRRSATRDIVVATPQCSVIRFRLEIDPRHLSQLNRERGNRALVIVL